MRLVRFLLGLSTRVKVAVAVVIVALGVFVIAYFEPHKLFIDEVVDEDFPAPAALATTTTAAAEATPATTAAVTTTTEAPTTTTAAPTTTTTVPEGPVLLSVSEWISIGHPGTGTVLVYRQPDGSHVVRFEDLDVSNGPDLLVILSAAPLVDDRAAYSEVAYLSLGDLKGNQGNQNYIVPAEVNLDEYQTVAIWCRRFNYTFNAAEIHSPPA
ncbi:MAG: DM13 domain-containing protein [Acidimicrobiia bacterium]|nr:DM13 domain-containing protein [Acidimicrobiia bacterium]